MVKMHKLLEKIWKDFKTISIRHIEFIKDNEIIPIATTIKFNYEKPMEQFENEKSDNILNIFKKEIDISNIQNYDKLVEMLKKYIDIEIEGPFGPDNLPAPYLDNTCIYCFGGNDISKIREQLNKCSYKYGFTSIDSLVRNQIETYVFSNSERGFSNSFVEIHVPINFNTEYNNICENEFTFSIKNNLSFDELFVNVIKRNYANSIEEVIENIKFNNLINLKIPIDLNCDEIDITIIESEMGLLYEKRINTRDFMLKNNLITNPLFKIFKIFNQNEEYSEYIKKKRKFDTNNEARIFENKIYEILTMGGFPTLWLFDCDSIHINSKHEASADLFSYNQNEGEIFVISGKISFNNKGEFNNLFNSIEYIKKNINPLFKITPCLFVRDKITDDLKEIASQNQILVFDKEDIEELYNTVKIRFFENKDFYKIQYNVPNIITSSINLKGENNG